MPRSAVVNVDRRGIPIHGPMGPKQQQAAHADRVATAPAVAAAAGTL